MIREALENFQITPNLTENIMHEISRLKPIAPSGSKPVGAVGNCCIYSSSRPIDVGYRQSIPVAFPKTLQFRCHVRDDSRTR